MSAPARFLPRLRPLVPRIGRVPRNAFITSQSQTGPAPIEPSKTQAHPLGAYYEAILNDPQPIPDVKPEEPPSSSPVPTPPPKSAAEKASIVFGSALAGPAAHKQRLEELRQKSTMIAGVLVPPRPEEPDNCCMSGCVNCVWERYREEMEDWSAANAEAQLKLREQKGASDSVTMDDDGGGSETNWMPKDPKITKNMWDEKLYNDVPVGIREFMKTEKKLKAIHEKEGTQGG
ncbi:oxidoreductase-like protein [Colletotrichum incanum]|uniref:Oxidoreductase-like protein n=1 Tax=Colletotrichum incanum TaxID=1573173 RepID=A0A166LN21_COLIC|nr:oxidoreductase-like protein [Colletotrichum incanum]